MNQDDELMAEHDARYGDPRVCPRHPSVATSSPDGMFDAPCRKCEAEMAAADDTPPTQGGDDWDADRYERTHGG